MKQYLAEENIFKRHYGQTGATVVQWWWWKHCEFSLYHREILLFVYIWSPRSAVRYYMIVIAIVVVSTPSRRNKLFSFSSLAYVNEPWKDISKIGRKINWLHTSFPLFTLLRCYLRDTAWSYLEREYIFKLLLWKDTALEPNIALCATTPRKLVYLI